MIVCALGAAYGTDYRWYNAKTLDWVFWASLLTFLGGTFGIMLYGTAPQRQRWLRQ